MLKNSLIKLINIKNIFTKEIFYVFLLAFILRSFYVFLDFPFVFHPDEPTVVNSTINLRYNPNPMHFDWPTFYYYFNYPFFYIYEKVYFLLFDLGVLKSLVIESINYYILSRFLTTIFGAATVVLVYLILKNLKISYKLSILGACIMAVIPFHVTRSAQALTDIPMVFFAGLSIYFLSKNLKQFTHRDFLWACFFAGLSVSTKYNGYMIFLSLGLYLLFIKGFSFKDSFLYLKSGLVSFFGFFIGTPYSVFDYETFLISDSPKGALWQFTNVGKVDFLTQITNFFNNFFVNNYNLMGYIPLIASTLYIFWFLFKKEFLIKENYYRFRTILVVQYLFIFWSVSGVELQRSHYLIMVYLFLPIFTVLLFEKFSNKTLIINSLVSLIFIFCIYSLYLRIDDESLAKFYKQVNLSSNREAYYVLYNKSETKKVLDKLDLPNSKINSNSSKIPSKTTHAVLTYDICENQSICKFDLIGKIDSRGDSEVIYVFKTNQNKN